MKPCAPSPELRQLVDRIHDGPPLSKPEMSRLEELLEDDQALAYYLSATQNEALISEVINDIRGVAAPARRSFSIPWLPVAFAAAASVIFLLGLGIGRRLPAPAESGIAAKPAPARPVQITGMVGVEWRDGSTPDPYGNGAVKDRISIKTGLVELTYPSGVRVTLEGPADFSISGDTSGRLDAGKLYTTVPKGAEGFRVDYAMGSVVDLGTEFAMDARPDGATELGVFEGEVELHRQGVEPISLFKNQALIHDNSNEDIIRAIPLDREKFVRELPSRDFRWESNSVAARDVSFDVSHLVWKPSEYRAIFKWMEGGGSIRVSNIRLCLDGVIVATDRHTGSTGHAIQVRDNVFSLTVPPGKFRRGRWTVHATIRSAAAGNQSTLSQGIMQFEEGLVSRARAEDFIGRWSYGCLGSRFIREFHPDGTVTLEKDGKPYVEAFAGSQWHLERGILEVYVPKHGITESHILRDDNTLIFVSQPYENATREPD